MPGPLGRACDMGDAMIGDAMRDCPGVHWYAVRNASDPQIPNPSGDIKSAEHEAGQIYAEWGAFTTAGARSPAGRLSTRPSTSAEARNEVTEALASISSAKRHRGGRDGQ